MDELTGVDKPEEEIKFPLPLQDKCPYCGCEEGYGKMLIKQLKKEGKISATAFPNGLVLTSQILDILHIQMEIAPKMGIFQIHYEICKECKKFYIRELNLTWQPLQFQMAQQLKNSLKP